MAVLKSPDGSELIVTCNCGCDNGIHMIIDEDDDQYCWMTYMNSNWYRDQEKKIRYVIWEKLKKIWAIIRSKDFYYSEICMSRYDFRLFRKYINEVSDSIDFETKSNY